MGIIENIVDRCHVHDSVEEVLDFVISKLVDGRKTWNAMTPNQQKSFKRAVAVKHAANHEMFHNVMSGRF